MQDKFNVMFESILYKNEEERLCNLYQKLMNRSYKIALFDKEKSDKLNARAKKIMAHLRKNNSKLIEE